MAVIHYRGTLKSGSNIGECQKMVKKHHFCGHQKVIVIHTTMGGQQRMVVIIHHREHQRETLTIIQGSWKMCLLSSCNSKVFSKDFYNTTCPTAKHNPTLY